MNNYEPNNLAPPEYFDCPLCTDGLVREQVLADYAALQRDREQLRRFVEAIVDLVWQNAYRTIVDGKRVMTTGGRSDLEEAFDLLGWPDPMPIPESYSALIDAAMEIEHEQT